MEKKMEEATKQEELEKKRFNISCCRSYLTPKGRCYTCPELDDTDNRLDDGLEDGSSDAEMQRDPDEEKW